MFGLFHTYLRYLWHQAASENNQKLAAFVTPAKKATVLDIGCDTGDLIIERTKNIKQATIYGIDCRTLAVKQSQKRGIKALKSDIEKKLPYPAGTFDIVSANQIIEHLVNVDLLAQEMHRVLKPGGYLVVATENLSSWHNIFALIIGWQAFSQTISEIKNVGNPVKYEQTHSKGSGHLKIFTLKGLRELLQLYGFEIEESFGAGYYPLPPFLANVLAKFDKTHAAFIGLKARKK